MAPKAPTIPSIRAFLLLFFFSPFSKATVEAPRVTINPATNILLETGGIPPTIVAPKLGAGGSGTGSNLLPKATGPCPTPKKTPASQIRRSYLTFSTLDPKNHQSRGQSHTK